MYNETYYKTHKAKILVKRKQIADTKRLKRALVLEVRLWHKLNRKETLPSVVKMDYNKYEKPVMIDLENGMYMERRPVTIYF